MAKVKPQRLTGKAEIERLIAGFGGRIGDKSPRRLLQSPLPSEATADLKQEIEAYVKLT